MQYFPGTIYHFVVAILCFMVIVPVFIGCVLALLGGDSVLGWVVRIANVFAAIYFPVWGLKL